MGKRIFLTLVVTLFSVLTLTGCGKTKIDLNDYLSVEATGYDTVGNVVVSFDYDKMASEHSKVRIKKDTNNLEVKMSEAFGVSPIETLYDTCIYYTYERKEGYSNGDVVEIKWKCNDSLAEDAFGCKLEYKDITYKVSGLKTAETFNPFDFVELTYSGYSPSLNVEAKIVGDYAQDLKVSVQKQTTDGTVGYVTSTVYGVKNGDTLKVEVTPTGGDYVKFVETYGILPSPTSMEVLVENQAYIIETGEQLTPEITKIIEEGGREFYEDEVNKLADTSFYKGIKYIGYYILGQGVVPVFEVSVNHPTDGDITYYMAAKYNTLYVETDGTLSFGSMDLPQTGFAGRVRGDLFDRNGVGYLGYESLESVKERYLIMFGDSSYETNLE